MVGWQRYAACRDEDPELFYPEKGVTRAARAEAARRQARAVQICSGCPVMSECLQRSFDDREEFGVWGGVDEDERRAVLKREGTPARSHSVVRAGRQGRKRNRELSTV